MIMKQHLLNYDKHRDNDYIEECYRDLFEDNDVYIKLMAIDFLYEYSSQPEHKRRFQSLYKRESDPVVKSVLKEVLDGVYTPSEDPEEESYNAQIDSEINETMQKMQDFEAMKQNSVKKPVESSLKFFHHNAINLKN